MTSVFHRESGKEYPLAAGGEGMYLRDAQGRQYLDLSGGAAISCLGHGHPGVIAAIKAQADRLAFAHTSFFSNAPQEELAVVIANRFTEPGARVYFTCDGSEATETALKLAWQYWQRLGKPEKRVVISRRFSYHGNTLGALSVSGNPARRAASEHVLHDWPRISPCFAWRHQEPGESEAGYGLRVARELEEAILAIGADNVAAFIAEPVSGASLGAVPAAAGYFREIRAICDRYGVLLILDEVMTGAGRTGTYFAFEQEGVVPDIVTLAKGLSGGYLPLGATLARAAVHEVFARQSFAHGHTYVGHALSCAAALAVQQALETEGLLDRVAGAGERLRAALLAAFGEHPHVGDIRGRGLLQAIELVADRETNAPFADELRLPARLKEAAMEEGLIIYPGGGPASAGYGPHILLAPPYIVEDRHIEEGVEKLGRVLAACLTTDPHPPNPPLPSRSLPPGEGGTGSQLSSQETGGGAPLPAEGGAMGEGSGVRSSGGGPQ